MRPLAFNTGPEFHGLDHIAPLAELIKMPLITTEELNFELGKRYYPQIEIRYMPDLEFRLGEIAEEFDTLFECKYWAAHLKNLFRQIYRKEMKLVFCPHGQSDKGYGAPLLAPYALQDGVLLYGDLQIEMLQELGIWSSLSSYSVVGNYRLEFYQKYRSFYDELIRKEIPLNRKNQTLLYAPTWRDADEASSFFKFGAQVISQLPSDWNLIIKVHPLLEQRDPAKFYSIAALVEGRENIFLVEQCPLIYPILSLADAYLGDSSSVGYDFLYFEKPLYFFPTTLRGRLHGSGQMIDPNINIYSQFSSNRFVEEQRRLYQFAFRSTVKGPLVWETPVI